MKYFVDTEFIDDGFTIDLISIGIVAEDGREYYAQSNQADFGKASQWVKDNVIAHLLIRDIGGLWKNRVTIKQDILSFMDVEAYGKPELWGWCASYDFVALCQLYGTMMDLPDGWPHYIRDIQYLLDERGMSDDKLPQQEEGLHNALADARHLKKLREFLQDA